MNSRDLETVSAYLDGQLSRSESARLEDRLKSDDSLRRLMDDLRLARGLLRQLPQRRAIRSFTLTTTNPRLRAPEPRAYPALRFAGVLTSLLFLASFAVNALMPSDTGRLTAASAPMLGGGVGAGPSAATAPAEGLVQPFSAIAPNTTATELPAESPVLAVPKALPSHREAPVPVAWQLILGSAAALLVGTAWYVRRNSIRSFRGRWVEK